MTKGPTLVLADPPPRALKPTERIARGMAVQAREQPAADARAAAHRFRPGSGEHPADAPPPHPSASELGARAAGLSVRTYERGRKILTAAEENPEKFADLLDRLDAGTGSISGCYDEMLRRQNVVVRARVRATLSADDRAQRREMRVAILRQVRAALIHLSSLPNAGEVAAIVRAFSRDQKFVDEKLAHSLKWLEEFANVWNRNSD